MITDAIHDYVAGQLSGLWSLPKPQRRARLAVELYRFQLPDQAANVRLQWGRDLYQMNADTPETEEKEN